jgi:hypothetical protein
VDLFVDPFCARKAGSQVSREQQQQVCRAKSVAMCTARISSWVFSLVMVSSVLVLRCILW